MYRRELQVAHRIRQARNSLATQMLVEFTPGMVYIVVQMLPIEEHVRVIRAEVEAHSFF